MMVESCNMLSTVSLLSVSATSCMRLQSAILMPMTRHCNRHMLEASKTACCTAFEDLAKKKMLQYIFAKPPKKLAVSIQQFDLAKTSIMLCMEGFEAAIHPADGLRQRRRAYLLDGFRLIVLIVSCGLALVAAPPRGRGDLPRRRGSAADSSPIYM